VMYVATLLKSPGFSLPVFLCNLTVECDTPAALAISRFPYENFLRRFTVRFKSCTQVHLPIFNTTITAHS